MATDKCELCGGQLGTDGKCKSCDSLLSLDLDLKDDAPAAGLDDLDAISDDGGSDDVDLDSTVKEVSEEIDLIMDAFNMKSADEPPPPPIDAVEPDLGEAEDAQLSQEGMDAEPVDLTSQVDGSDTDGSLEGEFGRAADEAEAPGTEDLGAVTEYADAAKPEDGDISDVELLQDEADEPPLDGNDSPEQSVAESGAVDAALQSRDEEIPKSKGDEPRRDGPAGDNPAGSNPPAKEKGNSGIGAAIAIILGILTVPVGFLVLAFMNMAMGGVVVMIGVLMLVIGAVLYFIGRKSK